MHETCVIPRANIHRLACALLFLCLSHATSVFGQNVFYEPLSAKTERIIAPATIKFELPLLPSATPNTASMAPMGVSGDPNDSFDNWYRYPAEERQWLVMDNVPSNPTSYYRDVETGAQTLVLSSAAPRQQQSQRAHAGVALDFVNRVPSSKREAPAADRSAIDISVYCPVELLLENPVGQQQGDLKLFSAGGPMIPLSHYEAGGLADDETGAEALSPSKLLNVEGPVAGRYTLLVKATGSGEYTLDVLVYDRQGHFEKQTLARLPVVKGELDRYWFYYDPQTAAKLSLHGGYSGDGLDSPVTYANLAPGTIRLEGRKELPVALFYSDRLQAASFDAQLGGTNVKNLFHPQPGTSEVVRIPVIPPTQLTLSASSNDGKQTDLFSIFP